MTALDPKMRAVLEKIERAQKDKPHFWEMSAPAARAAYAGGAEVLDLPRAPLAFVQALSITARDGAQLPACLYATREPHPYAPAGPMPLLLYFHGGGFTVGGLQTHDSLCRQFALRADCAVMALDYRLAPEHRFPTAAHDAIDALGFCLEEGGALGLDTARIAVGGDSAGGTLAAQAALWARDAGHGLSLQLLVYPGLAARQELASHAEFAQGYLITKRHIDWFFAHYIDEKDRDDPRFAPLKATSLAGLAPAWIGVAECDPLRDDGLTYAARLREAGVPCQAVVYAGMVHDFIKMGRVIPQASEAQSHAAFALKTAFYS